MKAVILLASLLIVLVPASFGQAGERLLLDSGRAAVFWDAFEPSGTVVQLDTVEDSQQAVCVRARCRPGGAAGNAGLQWRGMIPSSQAIGFRCLLSDGRGGSIRVLDDKGQWLAGGFPVTAGAWTDVRVPLVAASFTSHWFGPNDGQLHFPLHKVIITASGRAEEQEIRVSQLYAEADRFDPSQAWQVVVEPAGATGVAFIGEEVEYTIHVIRRLRQPSKVRLRLMGQAPNGPSQEIARWDVDADGWEHNVRRVRLPTTTPGYLGLRVEFSAEPGEPPQASVESGLAVVPRPRHYGQWAPKSYFGMQLVPNMETAERLGAKALREWFFWRFVEPEQGHIRWAPQDKVVAEARRHHMQVLQTVALDPPPWAARIPTGHSKPIEIPDPSRVGDFGRLAGEIAARYRDQDNVTAMEIDNEPNVVWVSHTSLPLQEGVEYFVPFLKAGSAAARLANPRLLIGMSESYFTAGKPTPTAPFTKAVLDCAADSLDLFTGHPYATPREFGPGKRAKWPMESGMASKCETGLEAMAAHGRPRRMWIGELGWELSGDTGLLSPYSLDYAACIAQGLIVGKSTPGVERHFHFTLHGGSEADYALMRGDPAYPLPAALAYAATAQALEDARPIERVALGGKVWRASFAAEDRDELVVAWWSEGKTARLRLPPGAPHGSWQDSLFRSVTSRQGILIDAMPRYWILPLKTLGEHPALLGRVQVVAP